MTKRENLTAYYRQYDRNIRLSATARPALGKGGRRGLWRRVTDDWIITGELPKWLKQETENA